MTELEREFERAIRFAKQPRPGAMLATLGLSNAVQWGAAMVSWWGDERRHYEPYEDGKSWALIAPVVEGGELIDLAAIELPNQHIGTRLGLGHGLGFDAIERARCGVSEVAGALEEHQQLFERGDLLLVERPLSWLRAPVDAVYLFNLSSLLSALDGVPQFDCDNVELWERVNALLPPSQRQRARVRIQW